MAMPLVECRVCKAKTDHKIVVVTENLPDYVHVMECNGCGVLGVMSWKQDLDA
jgi:MinD superfamily P-loop ATPase